MASFEGNEFIIERLGQGSIINYRLFFVHDNMHVSIRSASYCHILKLDDLTFEFIQSNHKKFSKSTLLY